jgi:hypothetical protein
MSEFVPCAWCKVNPGCENDNFHEKCEFRQLPYEKEAIVWRMKFEWGEVERLRKELLKGVKGEEGEKLAREVLDKTGAVQIMMKALVEDFQMRRGEIKNVLGLETPSVIETVKLMAKLQKLKHERAGR